MRVQITTDDVPEGDRFGLWSAAVFSTLAISAQPMPDVPEPFRARFCARSRGPLLDCSFDSDGLHATRQSREIAHRQWDTPHLLFEPTGGSFARHVLRRRLEECRTVLLRCPTRPVTDIAFGWGFRNLSTFYRAFKAAFGMTPGDLRATRGGHHS